MKNLVWQVLFFRLLSEQKKLFLAAMLTVSLGVALALGIRLGTQSAIESMENNSLQQGLENWSDVYQAETPEAALTLTDLASRFEGELFTSVDASLTSDHLAIKREQSVQLSVYWSPQLLRADGSSLPTNQNVDVILFSAPNCPLASTPSTLLKFNGASYTALILPVSQDSAPDCRFVATLFGFVRNTVLSDSLQRASLSAIFPARNASEKNLLNEIYGFAQSTPGIITDSNKKRLSRLSEVTASFRTNLQLMGLIALFIGFAIVHHIFSLIITKQSKTLASLTAFGIPKQKITITLLTLAAFVGFSASMLGTVLGIGCGLLLSNVASFTVKSLYDSLVDAGQLHWTMSDLGYGFGVGFVACFLGALHPIYRMTKIPVAQIMRDGSFEAHDTGFTQKQKIAMTLFVAVGCLVCLYVPVVWNRIPVTALLACLGILVLSAMIAQQFGYLIYSASQTVHRHKRYSTQLRIFLAPQTAVVIQVLTLTFTLTFGVKGMAESFRYTLVEWSKETLKADLWIRSLGGNGSQLPSHVEQSLIEAKNSGTAIAVDSLTILPAVLRNAATDRNKPVLLATANFMEQSKVTPLRVIAPEPLEPQEHSALAESVAQSGTACAATPEQPCAAFISEPVSVHFSLREPLGRVICPEIRSQKLCFKVVGLYQDFGSDQGVILTDRLVFDRLIPSAPRPSFSNVYLRDPNSSRSIKLSSELKYLADTSEGTLGFESLKELRERIMTTFDNTFRITDMLYVLCGLIAIIATVSSLNLQIILRSREWSLLWSIGLSQSTLLRRFSFWSAFVAFVAAVVSIFGGLALASVLVYAVNYYSFGYSLTLKIPIELPVIVVLVATVCGFLSGRMQAYSLIKNISLKTLNRE